MESNRETIGSRLGFIMLTAGCAIGLGNVWRFPYITGAHGGALFVILYLIFLVMLGFPVMVMELAVGRASGRGLYGAFRDLPEKRPSKWKYPAAFFFSGNLILMMMYTTVTGWMLCYCVDFISGNMSHLTDMKIIEDHFTGLLGSPLKMGCYTVITTLLGSLVCAGGLRSGVERITKLLMGGLFLLLITLCIYTVTLPGAREGLSFYLMPDFSKLTGGNLFDSIVAAMGQAFFTLSLGVGSIAIYGSYIDRNHTLATESIWIILCDTVVALLSGVVIFPACFTYDITVGSGPGLVLITLSGIFNQLPGGQFWGALFFLFLTIAAVTTVIAVFENLIAFMIDEWKFSRKKASLINFIAVSLLSIPCVLGFNLLSFIHPMGGSSTILDFEDWLVSSLLLPLGSLTTLIFCCWTVGWGWKKFLAEANTGKGIHFPVWLKYYIMIVPPVLILFLFALGFYKQFIQ